MRMEVDLKKSQKSNVELPTISKKSQAKRVLINKLEGDIGKAIDSLCEESGYQIEYAEINLALTNILHRNLGYENYPRKS